MDPKSARNLIDEICDELDRRKERLDSLMKNVVRPVGLGLMLSVGAAGMVGCSDDDGKTKQDTITSSFDAYGVADGLPADGLPPTADAYGIPAPDSAYGVPDYTPPTADAYGIPADQKPADVTPPPPPPPTDIAGPADAYGIIADAGVWDTGTPPPPPPPPPALPDDHTPFANELPQQLPGEAPVDIDDDPEEDLEP